MTQAELEQSPMRQLEKWASDNDAWFSVRRFWVHLECCHGLEVVAFRCPSEMRDYQGEFKGATLLAVGTDDSPAHLDDMILAALQKWHQLKEATR